MSELRTSFLQVETKTGRSFGGNQAWFAYPFLKKSGCGVISAANLLLYMKNKQCVTEKEYMDFARQIWLQYFPVVPGFGMNGLILMLGLNRYFYKNGMPQRAYWKISGRGLWNAVDKMLSKDIPVILAVGPNFPKMWKKEKLSLYTKSMNGNYVAVSKVHAHYVTVTARHGLWLQISSWGKQYFINIEEYRAYVKKHSSYLLSNIIFIK